MPREFICHRCGTANRRPVENCRYCGLQVGWRPSFPDTLRIWRWPAGLMETAGSLAASFAALIAMTYPGTWAATIFAWPLLAFSSFTLFWHFLSQSSVPGRPE